MTHYRLGNHIQSGQTKADQTLAIGCNQIQSSTEFTPPAWKSVLNCASPNPLCETRPYMNRFN